jgi:predicted GH43/DUF377 family glycosyl hydrolase
MKELKVIFCALIVVLGVVGIAKADYSWTRYGDAPVLGVGPAGSWDDYSVSSPSVMKEGNIYKMWYEGNSVQGIGYASSVDGVHWNKYGGPVLAVGGGYSRIGTPSVIKDGDTYKMWYLARTTGYDRAIGYATSSDGTSWTKYGSLVLTSSTPVSWENETGVADPFVMKDGSTYKMWYAGHVDNRWQIGYATSPDGTNWLKIGAPVLDLSAWGTEVLEPSVTLIKGDEGYTMWYGALYQGNLRRIGYATSVDGINWTDHGDSILEMGTWDSYSLGCPSVIKDGDVYKMWYAGSASYMQLRIGYATSETGPPPPVPAPATLFLLTSGLIGLTGFRKKFSKR